MKITSQCRGCRGLTGNMTVFDVPRTVSTSPSPPTSNPVISCACNTIGDNLVRAPYESEFVVQFQQAVQSYDNICVRKAVPCSYGTPFELDMHIDVAVDGITLTETQMNQAVEAFMRASNTAYAATSSDCQPEFRRLEQIKGHNIMITGPHTGTSSCGEVGTNSGTSSSGEVDPNSRRDLVQAKAFSRMTLRLKTSGLCNACSGKAYLGSRADLARKQMYPKSRQLQEAYDMSHCFCPLGSEISREPMSRDLLIRLFLEELTIIGSPIKKVTSMSNVRDTWISAEANAANDKETITGVPDNVRRLRASPRSLQAASSPPSLPPTKAPTLPPTKQPTLPPTLQPTAGPTLAPTKQPTLPPTKGPTLAPTKQPTLPPTKGPTLAPTKLPTKQPTYQPLLPSPSSGGDI